MPNTIEQTLSINNNKCGLIWRSAEYVQVLLRKWVMSCVFLDENIARDMQVNVAGLRRNLKNIAHNYSDAQKKVREATSNDPWGPSSTLMAEIADLTYNVVAFTEIMQMIWKRLNDHGRNWRHVYKALVLVEYLIKAGSEKVGQQCKENIYAIQTLKDFQYLEEGSLSYHYTIGIRPLLTH